MPFKHTVKQGECISSIAYMYGYFADTLWEDSSNSTLKNKRKDMNCLCIGDEIIIPEKSEKKISFQSGKRKRFKRKGVPSELRLQIMVGEQKIADASYIITIDKKEFQGKTDSEGNIVISIPPNAQEANIIVNNDDRYLEYNLLLGHLDSADSISGVQSILKNLGYVCNDQPGEMGKDTIEALKAFQKKQGLSITGELDKATNSALENTYNS